MQAQYAKELTQRVFNEGSNMPDNYVGEKRGLLRRLVRWLIRRYYPNVEISNAERIPQSGPVLLCANHANALVDPILIGVVAQRPVRFMAKAPLFEVPVLGPVMHALGMIPAYRGSDDSSEVRRNLESLEVGAQALIDGNAMGIFPEGKSTDQAHLEMVRSGAARMAIQACEDEATNVQLVPIGITYERKEEFRSSVWIQVGEPIDVGECIKQNDGNVRAARRALTQQLEVHLKDVVVHLDEPAWEPWLDDLQTLAEAPNDAQPLPPLRRRKRLADAMNHFLENDRSRTETLASDIREFRDHVEAAGLRIESPVLRMHGLKVCAELLWGCLWSLLLLIPTLMGTLHHLFPFVVVRVTAARIDRARKAVSTYRLLVGVPVYLAWYVIVAWWVFGYFANWFAWTWMITAPFCGVIAIQSWRRGGRIKRLLWHQLRVTLFRGTLKRLREQESMIRNQLKELADEYAAIVPRFEAPEPVVKRRRLGRIASRVVVILLVAAAAWIAKYRFFDDPLLGDGLNLGEISKHRIEALLAVDEVAIMHLIDGLDELDRAGAAIQAEFGKGTRSFTNQADNDDIRALMRRFLTYRNGLLRIAWKYQRYADIDDEALRLRTFLLDFTAAASLYQGSLKFVRQFGDTANAVSKLNEEEPNWGIPPGLYDTVRRNLASPQNVRMFELARQFYHQPHVQDRFKALRLFSASPYDRLHQSIAAAEKAIFKYDESVSSKILKVAVADLRRLIARAQYKTQSVLSTWIGDFKIRQPHSGKPLINKDQLARLADLLEPGDIILERRNWYLSNAFLPGYWPHGAVYVGTAEELQKRGLDKDQYVAQHWATFSAKDPEGHEHVIIEAVSEGVVFSSLEHSIGEADSVAVLRPKVSEQEKNKAITLAFSYAGRPYDFEFDFDTTDMLVCTEVIYRTYGGNSGPIDFPVEEIMGRQTMPAINLVKKFDREYGTDEAQFEFVAFIDGDEQAETSYFRTDVQSFRDTVNRPASSFIQGTDPFALKGIGYLGQVILALTVAAGLGLLVVSIGKQFRVGEVAKK
jgi:1-acyl-sn-glycerol-3-phosphate acyltransferase